MSITSLRTCRRMVQQAGRSELGRQRRPPAGCGYGQRRDVRDPLEMLGDWPQVLLGGHPMQRVEAGQVDRAAVSAQCPLAFEVEVLLEVRHRQLAERPVDRLSIAQPRELAGPDRTPEAAPPEGP